MHRLSCLLRVGREWVTAIGRLYHHRPADGWLQYTLPVALPVARARARRSGHALAGARTPYGGRLAAPALDACAGGRGHGVDAGFRPGAVLAERPGRADTVAAGSVAARCALARSAGCTRCALPAGTGGSGRTRRAGAIGATG